MATLVQRIMQDTTIPSSQYIPRHEFFAALTRVAGGRFTPAQIKAHYNMQAGSDADDFDWLVAKLAPLTVQNRLAALMQIDAIFGLAEAGDIQNHTNPAEVQAEITALLT